MATEDLERRWAFFEQAGPTFSEPITACCVREALARPRGTLYAALYPDGDFDDLVDFNLFQRYSSSAQQSLIETGEIEWKWFLPESREEGVAAFETYLEGFRARLGQGDVRAMLEGLGLPEGAAWVLDLDFDRWEFVLEDDTLELTARTDAGYLAMFVVADG